MPILQTQQSATTSGDGSNSANLLPIISHRCEYLAKREERGLAKASTKAGSDRAEHLAKFWTMSDGGHGAAIVSELSPIIESGQGSLDALEWGTATYCSGRLSQCSSGLLIAEYSRAQLSALAHSALTG